MPSEEEGNKAMTGLNNKEIEGRALSVSLAKEKEDGSGSSNSVSRSNNKRLF